MLAKHSVSRCSSPHYLGRDRDKGSTARAFQVVLTVDDVQGEIVGTAES